LFPNGSPTPYNVTQYLLTEEKNKSSPETKDELFSGLYSKFAPTLVKDLDVSYALA